MRIARVAILLVLGGALTACSSDFSRLVREIDAQPGVKRQYIPMLGLARTGVRMIHPHGVHDFRLAVFEHDGGSIDTSGIDAVLERMPEHGWSPLVRVTAADGERTAIFARERGSVMQMLVVAHEPGESVVVTVAMDPELFFEQLAESPADIGGDAMWPGRPGPEPELR